MPTNTDLDYRTAEALSNRGTLATGQVSVGSAGTAEALATDQPVPDGTPVAIRANSDNATPVYIGDSSVTASIGIELTAGDGITLNINDVSEIYVDADTSGDGVSWIVEVDN